MIITSIEKQKHNENRYSVFIDGEFVFGLDGIDLLQYKLKENETISEQKVNNIIENNVYSNAKNKALKYLAFKSRTEKEIITKLQENDFSETIVYRVIEFLKKYNYINDVQYAKSYIKDRTKINKYGLIRISYELASKGIDKTIIDNMIEQLNIDEIETAVALINKKIDRIDEIDLKEKKKIYNFLLRKGYSNDIIKESFSISGL